MREIKFRAWTDNLKDGGKMYEGYSDGKDNILFTPAGYGLMNTTLKIMQFTGLHDKNGIEIFEGDIVRNKDGEVYAINFEFNSFNGRYMPEEWELEVIGDIYQNPELI